MADKQYCSYCGKELSKLQIRRRNKCCCRACGAKLYQLNMTDEQRLLHSKKVSEATKAAMARPEVKEHHRQSMIEWANRVCTTEAYKANMSKILKKTYESQELRQKISNAVKSSLAKPEVKEKLSNSLKKAYENPELHKKISERTKQALANPEIKERQIAGLKKAYTLNKKEIIAKIAATKKANGTSKDSSEELDGFRLLQSIFPDTIHHYTSDVYPFDCDYYVPSKDLYIEGHFGWYHNGRPFIGNEQDLKDLIWLKEKAKTSGNYANKIYQWTDLDVRKRQTVEKNSLNYKEVYSLEELKFTFNIKEN